MTLLQDLHVIEISASGAAATAGKHFADWGARVTLLERASGTPLRDEPPYYERYGERRSATWAWLARGTTAVRARPADALAACERADVVVLESETTREVLGIEPGEVRGRLEGKTTCVLIAPFATDGPYAHYGATDLGLAALGGWMGMLGDADREPLRPGAGLVPRLCGLAAFVAALVGLRHVRRGGAPQFIDLSAQALATSMMSAPWLAKSMLGIEIARRGNNFPLGVMECADGFVGIPPLTAQHWDLMCQLMGIADVLEQPHGRDPNWRMLHGNELYHRVEPWLRDKTRAEIFEEAQAWRLPGAPVQTIAERLACPQLGTRGFWRTIDVDGAQVKTPRVVFSIDGASPSERGQPREADAVDITNDAPRAPAGDAPALPFDGLRVVDLTGFWSGPFATMLLGSLGADVIKVESIQRPDPYRYTLAPLQRDNWYEWSPVWSDSNCDKRDITLDLSSERGHELLERLIADADIVVSNFANRVLPNLGLTSDQVLAMNPNVIAVTMPGYGPGGPWEGYVGYAIAFEQLVCGSMTGYADGAPSYGAGFCDPAVGMHTVAAIELALRQRDATGKGMKVEVPQCEILDSLFAPEQIAVQLGAPVPSRRGNKHDWMAPHDAYRVAGEDAWVTIAVASDEEFASLANAVGRPELGDDERFATVAARKANEVALDAAVAEAVRDRDALELERELQEAGVKACRAIKPWTTMENEGLAHIGFFQELTRPQTGTHPFKTWPFRFSSIDASHKRQPALLGEHNEEVLGGMLGLSSEELARLEDERVIGNVPLALMK